MRLFSAVLVIVVLFALDQAFMNGQNATLLVSLVRRAMNAVNAWIHR